MRYYLLEADAQYMNEICRIIDDRIRWMDRVGIRQWNTTDYWGVYPRSYYQWRAERGELLVFVSEDDRVVAAGALLREDPRWEEVCDTYLQLHEQIDQRVYDMAAQVTAGITTPYGKAMALQNFLASNFVYDLDVPQQPANQDFVSTFLVETKAGYCTYFASAMTVMCRMAGLPARYVEGFVAYPDAEGMAVVTGQEGHAWTEVYFRGFGWVTFDATPVLTRCVSIHIEPSSAKTRFCSVNDAVVE